MSKRNKKRLTRRTAGNTKKKTEKTQKTQKTCNYFGIDHSVYSGNNGVWLI